MINFTLNQVAATAAALSCVICSTAYGATIEVPFGNVGGLSVASNNFTPGNQYTGVWTGVAQSFTAEDERIGFGYYFFQGNFVLEPVVYTLYAGDGVLSAPLAQRSISVGFTAPFTPTLHSVDFSNIALTVGQQYTVVASLPSGALPALGTAGTSTIPYAGLNNPYGGGRFYYVGSTYDMSLPEFANRDLAFNVTPVPEVSTAAMFLTGVLAIGTLLRTRRRTRN